MSASINTRGGSRYHFATMPGRSVSRETLSLSLFHLAHLLRAGVGLNEALQEVQEMERCRRLRAIWGDIREQLRSGVGLSQAMDRWPVDFDTVVRALIRAGEVNGELEISCASCCKLLDWNTRTRSRMITALVYPSFALLILTVVVVFLFVSVVPSLSGFIETTQADMGWHTRGLLQVSDWLRMSWLPATVSMLLLVLGVSASRRYLPRARLVTDRCWLRLPVVGQLIMELSLSRYASICGRLYRSGVDLDQALAISESVLGNRALVQAFTRVRVSVVAGLTLSEAIESVPGLPSSFRRLLSAGESTGALGQALAQAGDQHQRHAQHRMDRLERLVGPTILMLVGLTMLWIILSILGPVYESAIDAVLLS